MLQILIPQSTRARSPEIALRFNIGSRVQDLPGSTVAGRRCGGLHPS